MTFHEFTTQGVLDWLLEPSNPSVRYWTLRNLIHRPKDDKQVLQTQNLIPDSENVKQILEHQIEDTYWCKPDDMYNPKYQATTHSLLILAELGMICTSQIQNAIEFIFQFQRTSGHFLIPLPKSERGRKSAVKDACCIDGNVLTYLAHFEYTDDPRFQQLLEFQLEHYDQENGGWPCRAYSGDPSKLIPINCYMGRMKVLRGLSYLPKTDLSQEFQKIIANEVEEILENSILNYLKHPDGTRKEKTGWKKFGFPLFYNTDVLEVLDTLIRLGIKDDRMQSSIEIVLSQQQKDGRWLMRNSFNGKMYCDIENKNKASKWITLRALRVLQNWN